MMTHRPFEVFCRNHFVDSFGKLQDIDANTREAKRKRNERKRGELTHQLRILQKDLSELYKRGQAVREEKGEVGEVQDIFQRAGKVRKRVTALREELKKIKKEK